MYTPIDTSGRRHGAARSKRRSLSGLIMMMMKNTKKTKKMIIIGMRKTMITGSSEIITVRPTHLVTLFVPARRTSLMFMHL